MRKRFLVAKIAAMAFIALPVAAAVAQTAEPGPSPAQTQVGQAEAQVAGTTDQAPQACDLSEEVKTLNAVRNNASLGYLDALREETEARERLLEAAIVCDQREITSLTEALESLPEDVKAMPAYKGIVEGLANAAIFYSEHRSRIPALGPQDIRPFSRAISDRRKEVYVPLVAWADNLILWSDNQELMDRASNRLAQVNRLVASLKLVNQEGGIGARFDEAKVRLENAFAENDRAKDALDRGEASAGLEHIQASLRALADTYEIFLDLQEELKNTLG